MLMPTPSGRNRRACSKTRHAMPRSCEAEREREPADAAADDDDVGHVFGSAPLLRAR
jgi:hypothetical protein